MRIYYGMLNFTLYVSLMISLLLGVACTERLSPSAETLSDASLSALQDSSLGRSDLAVDQENVDQEVFDRSQLSDSLDMMTDQSTQRADQALDLDQEPECPNVLSFVETETGWHSSGEARLITHACSQSDETLGVISVFEAAVSGTYRFFSDRDTTSQAISLQSACDDTESELSCRQSSPNPWRNGDYVSVTQDLEAGERVYVITSRADQSAEEASEETSPEEDAPRILSINVERTEIRSLEVPRAAARLSEGQLQLSFDVNAPLSKIRSVSARLTDERAQTLTRVSPPWLLTHRREGAEVNSAQVMVTSTDPLVLNTSLRVEVKITDQDQVSSEWITAPFVEPRLITDGEECTFGDLFTVCHPSSACLFQRVYIRSAAHAICVPKDPLLLHDLEVFYTPELKRFGVRASVEARPDQRPRLLVFSFYDTEGREIIGRIYEHHFSVVPAEEGELTLEYDGAWIEGMVEPPHEISVSVIDEVGHETSSLRRVALPPIVAVEGAQCSLRGGLSQCAPELTCLGVCLPADHDLSTCLETLDVEVITGEMGMIEGDLSSATMTGSWCRGGGLNTYYRFTAPRASFYSFDVRSSAFDPIISLSGDCYTDRVACNDDGYYGDDAVINRRLLEGETVYIRVGAFGSTGFGAYRLSYRPCHIEDPSCY